MSENSKPKQKQMPPEVAEALTKFTEALKGLIDVGLVPADTVVGAAPPKAEPEKVIPFEQPVNLKELDVSAYTMGFILIPPLQK
jgi:hypothetical protein